MERYSSLVGPGYHWQAELWVVDIFGGSALVDADITSDESGDVETKTETLCPFESWATANLTVADE